MKSTEELFMQYCSECGMDEDDIRACSWHKAGMIEFADWLQKQLLQQTQCTTLRKELEQMLNSEQKATDKEGDIETKYEMYKYVDAIKMVLLLIDARQPVA